MKLRKLIGDITGHMSTPKKDDHEVEMALNDLYSIVHRASELAKRIKEEGVQELEGWVQAKITKSADYMNSVYSNFMFADEDSYHDCNCGSDVVELNEVNPNSTCCGKCGHFHVKGTSCPKPFLTGNNHCRNRPRR